MPRLSKSFMALWALNMLQTLAAISIKFNYSIAKVVSLMTEKCRLNQISDLFLKIELFTEKLLAWAFSFCACCETQYMRMRKGLGIAVSPKDHKVFLVSWSLLAFSFIYPPIHPSIHPFIHPSIHSSIHSFVHLLRKHLHLFTSDTEKEIDPRKIQIIFLPPYTVEHNNTCGNSFFEEGLSHKYEKPEVVYSSKMSVADFPSLYIRGEK